MVDVTGNSINTTGYGILGGDTVSVTRSAITSQLGGIFGARTVAVVDSTITQSVTDHYYGLYYGIYMGGGTLSVDRSRIASAGAQGAGIALFNGETVTLNQSEVESANGAVGILFGGGRGNSATIVLGPGSSVRTSTAAVSSGPADGIPHGIAARPSYFNEDTTHVIQVDAGAEISVSAPGADGIHIARSYCTFRMSPNYLACGNATGTGTLVNRGTISSSHGTAVYEGQGDTLIVNSGTLIGGGGRAIDLGPGNDRVVLQTGSVIMGDVGGGAGINSLTLQGTGQVNSVFHNFQTLEVSSPGMWVFGSDSSFPGGTSINGGTLQVNGVLASPVTVNAGGILGGVGAVSSVVANPNGVVAPGSSAGTLAVQGNATLLPGAIYQVAFSATGDASHMNVGGVATVGGASLRLLANPDSTFRLNERYALISAAGGVQGQFSTASSPPLLVSSVAYDANNVFLTLGTNFVAGAITPNQRNVAAYLDRVAGDPGMQSLVGRLLGMSLPQAPPTFASMDGELHASLSTAMLNQGSQALRRLGGRLAMLEGGVSAATLAWSGLKVAGAAPAASDMPPSYAQTLGPAGLGFTGPGFWIQGVGDFSNVDGDPNAAGYRYRSGGVATGVDAQVAADTYLGASFSYLSGSMTLDGRNDSSNVNSPQIGLYASHRSGDLSVKAIAGYAWNRYGTSRTVLEGNTVAIARGNYNGGETSAYLEGAYTLPYFDRSVQPVVALQGVWLSQDGFTENGAGAASLRVAEQNPHSLVSYLGSRFFPVVNETARVELRALWAHEFADTALAINGSMVGASTPVTFTTTGVSLPRDAAVLGAGLVAKPYAKLSLFLDYNATLNSQQTTQTIVGGLRYAW
jgi:autotransporter-associated beta strand protein